MEIIKNCLTLFIIVFFVNITNAQNCNRQIKIGLLKGSTYTAECDSMIVLDNRTYESLYNRIFYDEAIIQNQDRLDSMMRAESIAKDSLIGNLDKKIVIQGEAIKEYRTQIDTLIAISNKSFNLNDQAIRALKKEKNKNKFMKVGFFAAGGICLFLIGLVVAGI
jgi:hypothetical protein